MFDGHTAISSSPSDPKEGTQSPWTLMEAVNYQQFYYFKQIQSLSWNKMDIGPFRNEHILSLPRNFSEIWYIEKLDVIIPKRL